MKRNLIVFFSILVLMLPGCSKKVEEKNILKTNAESRIMISGETTDDFNIVNWAAFENIDKKSSFIEGEIKEVKDGENIVDAYIRGSNIYIVLEHKSGEISYNILKDGKLILLFSREEALDEGVLPRLGEIDEFWGFKRQGEYLAVIKNTGTEIYKNDIKLFQMDGVAAIGDIDNNSTLEIVHRNSDGSKLSIFELEDEKLKEIWKYDLGRETFHGDIQIGDLNQDGVKEIYLDNINGGVQKFILSKDGFSQDFNLPVDKSRYENGSCFIFDINGDNKMDFIIQRDGLKPLMFIQK